MIKGNIRLYDTEVEYLAEKGSFELPNVSFVEDIKTVFYSGKLTKSWDTMANGVYAVGADGSPVMLEDADKSCIGVALIANDAPVPQRLMIEKYGEGLQNRQSIKTAYDEDGATNTEYTYFGWGPQGVQIDKITDYVNEYGNLPMPNGEYQSSPHLSADYTTWLNGVLSEFNGKSNTAALLETPDTDDYTTYANMATWCKHFNKTMEENQGYTDWYIPACGQLALIYLNIAAINEIMDKIGGTSLITSLSSSDETAYRSSSEGGQYMGCYAIYFHTGRLSMLEKYSGRRVRFVRDLI